MRLLLGVTQTHLRVSKVVVMALGPLGPLGPLGGPSPMSPGPGREEGAVRKVCLCTSTACVREGDQYTKEVGPTHEGGSTYEGVSVWLR